MLKFINGNKLVKNFPRYTINSYLQMPPTMRLDAKTQNIIKTEVANLLGAGSVVRLFGSRVDDNQRGGDIDLLIECPVPLENKVQTECRLAARLYIRLGGRKVDVLIKDSLTPLKPVHQQAIEHGVVL